MILRYCLPRVAKRGHGLANELIPWARAFLAAQILGARLLPPAFALNRRRYWRHFGTPLDDWIRNRAIEHLLPRVEFAEEDYLEHGGNDLLVALRSFAAAHGLYDRAGYVLTTSGMWGGFRHIAPARDFVRATLYQSRYAAGNLLRLQERLDPEKILVGMHVRLGDFRAAGKPGDFGKVANMCLPIEWFCNIAAALKARFADEVQFLVVSDGTADQLRPLTTAFSCLTTNDLANSDCSDVLALANMDLLVCSASTYSALAAFLSNSPYLWFAPSLYLHAQGCYSMGDYTMARGTERAAVSAAVAQFEAAHADWLPRGFAIDMDGNLPGDLAHTLVQRRAQRLWQFDLISHGVAPNLRR